MEQSLLKTLVGKASVVCVVAAMLAVIPASAPEAMSNQNQTYSNPKAFIVNVGVNMVIKNDGSLWTWGDNKYGILGDGTTAIRTLPVKIMDNVTETALTLRNEIAIAIKEDKSLWGWGRNSNGELGDGTKEEKHTPIKIMDGVVFARVTDSFLDYNIFPYCILAIKTDGSLWGIQQNGPFKILDDVVFIDICGSHAAAIKTDGSLWTWGSNNVGAIGDGTTDGDVTSKHSMQIVFNLRYPKKILENVKYVSTKVNITTALLKDGSLWTWGNNRSGQLGDGTTEDSYVPIKILEEVIGFEQTNDANHTVSMALKTDGSLWIWGPGTYMGDGKSNTTLTRKPSKIMDNIVDFSVDDTNSAAIKEDGSLWSWGLNYGVATSNTATLKPAYAPVKTIDDALFVYTRGFYTLAVKKDGSLWAWGIEIKDGSFTDLMTLTPPRKIMDNVKLPTTIQMPPATPALVARPTSSTILVNGKLLAFDAYNIEGNNYFKLRDLAYTLSGTEKQFEIDFDSARNVITLKSGIRYTAVGGEMMASDEENKEPTATSSKLYHDGKEVQLIAYSINGNNYFKLRDIGALLDFGVDWDGAINTIIISTGKSYTP